MSRRASSSCWDASTASANMSGANALMPSSAYMYQRSRAAGSPSGATRGMITPAMYRTATL